MLKLAMVLSFHPYSMCEKVERVTKKLNTENKLLRNKQKKINKEEKKKNYIKNYSEINRRK